MKIVCYLSMTMLGLFALTTGASADPSDSNSTDNSLLQTDPDGVPLLLSQPQPLSQGELDAIQEAQEKAVLNKDWLLRGYEQQLRAHAAADPSEDPNANFYFELSSNKALAKLAGVPALDSDGSDSTAAYRTGATPSVRGAATLRTDTSSAAATSFQSHGNLFQPLITPLSVAEAGGLHNFYSFQLPVSMASPLVENLPHPTAPKADSSPDSPDIDTPGMVAAETNPLTDTSSSDLSLDLLPGETIEQAKAREETNNELELPLPMDAGQLHQEQTATLSAPGVPHAAQAPTPAPVTAKQIPVNDDVTPLPVSKAPQINPVRTPIANPYDILDR
jgi:hypothetical protein